MAQLPDMSRLRLHPCAVPTGAKKKKKRTDQDEEPVSPDRPHGQPKKKAKDAQHYREAVETFFKEHVLTSVQRRELLAIIAEDYPQHTFPQGDWIMSALPQSLLATIDEGSTQAGQWKWKLEKLRMAIGELQKRETARKKKKGAPGSSAQSRAKKKKQEQRAADAENAKKPQAVMGREVLSDKEQNELSKKFPYRYDRAPPKVLGARKAPGCCMQRR